MNVLLYTSQYPSPAAPQGAIFTHQLMKEISAVCNVKIVNPIPWFPKTKFLRIKPEWKRIASIPDRYRIDDIDIEAVRYPFIPKISGILHPALQVVGSYKRIAKLHKQEPFDLINAHWVYPDGVAAVWIGKKLGIPVVLTAMGCDVNLYGNIPGRRNQIAWAFRNCQRITTKSKALAQAVKEFEIDALKIIPISNGVDFQKFRSIKESVNQIKTALGLKENIKHILFVGRLSEEKGVLDLIRAFGLVKAELQGDCKLIMIGEGELFDKAVKEIKYLKLTDSVLMLGVQSHEMVSKYMKVCDVLSLSSLREGMPNVVLEALASGMPVVATDVGGVKELVNEANGVTVEPANPNAFSKALLQVLGKEWDKETIQSCVLDRSWENVAKRYIEVYRSVSVKK